MVPNRTSFSQVTKSPKKSKQSITEETCQLNLPNGLLTKEINQNTFSSFLIGLILWSVLMNMYFSFPVNINITEFFQNLFENLFYDTVLVYEISNNGVINIDFDVLPAVSAFQLPTQLQVQRLSRTVIFFEGGWIPISTPASVLQKTFSNEHQSRRI